MRLNHPFANGLLEPEIRAVADVALANGRAALEKIGESLKDLSDPLCRIAFYRAAHTGFVRAQTSIIERILSTSYKVQLEWQDELTFRKIIDAIAWQILDRQLYIARRLCRGGRPVPLHKRSDLRSVIDAAKHWQGDDLTRFALISDASTFINVGDLLITEPLDNRLSLVEVKTGDVNNEVLEIVHSMPNVSKEQFEAFLRRHGDKGFDQVGRVVRQAMRMTHIAEFFNTGESKDPDSSETVTVTEDKVEADTYDRHLGYLFDRAKRKKLAIEFIEECFVVGVFRGATIPTARRDFSSWLQLGGWDKNFIKCDLVESMAEPLALPLFSRELEPENIFDILFGRTTVLMGLHIDKFMELSNKLGVPMRWSSRKTAASIPKSKIGIKVDNRVLLAGEGKGSFAVGGGYALRIFFHGLTPRFMIELLGRQLLTSTEPR